MGAEAIRDMLSESDMACRPVLGICMHAPQPLLTERLNCCPDGACLPPKGRAETSDPGLALEYSIIIV